jgi:DNA-binding response OmpR family regulator
VQPVSAGRALIWSLAPGFVDTVASYLTRWHLDVSDWESLSSIGGPAEADLVVADLDRLPETWRKQLSQLRLQNRSTALVLVSARSPDFARLHSWRPYAYVRKPFSAEDMMRVVHDLLHRANLH